MASYYGYVEIKIDGESASHDSIREAVLRFSPECEITTEDENTLIVSSVSEIAIPDDACDFAIALAKVAGGANFDMEGSTESSVSGETMSFVATLCNGELTMQESDWYNEFDPSEFEDYETFDEYLDEGYEDDITEEIFKMLKTNKTYLIGDEYLTEIPYCEPYRLDF